MPDGAPRHTSPHAEVSQLVAALKAALGDQCVSTDASDLALHGMDVYRVARAPVAIVRPTTTAATAKAVALVAGAGVAIVARGGGASYSDGYLYDAGPSVLFDMARLDAIEIDEDNAVVTVGAGVTWAALRAALDARGWRTPFWGPFSGIAATVAGTMSQNAISHGSGEYGPSAPSALCFEVVLASGDVLRTGLPAAGGKPSLRHFGPDLTGLFTGDCGALGLKTAVSLPLMRKKAAFGTVSWSFANFASLHAGMRAVAIERLDSEHFALDAALSQGQIAREERAGRHASIAASVLKEKGLAAGFAQLAKMGVSGDRALKEADFACHFIVEGVDSGEVKSRLKRLRTVLSDFGGEIANTVPEVVRGMPFAPLFNTLGPKGERWVPVHGILPHDAVLGFHVAFDEYCEANAQAFEEHGLWVGAMFECVGESAFLYEIALYWPDARTAFHEAVIDRDYLASLPTYRDNPATRAFAARVKADLIDLYARHGAGHFQIGRAYPFASRLEPSALALLQAIKTALDPHGRMNPGVLGLGG